MYRDFKLSVSPAPTASGGSNRAHRIPVVGTCRPWCRSNRAGWVMVALFALLQLSPVPLRAEIDWNQPITFDRAYQIALAGTPVTALLAAQLEAAEGRLEQAGLKPNPSIGAEVENVLGTGPFDGLDRAEVTLGVFQLIERGQKRQRREDLAARSKELLQWDYEEAVALLRYDLRQAFSQALIAQQNVALQVELLKLSRESEVEMERLANAARTSAIDLSQARLATRRQVYHVESAGRELREKRVALSTFWNGINPVEFELKGELTLASALPPFESLKGLLEKTPALARFDAEKAVQEASVELARARSHRDVEVFAGARYFNEDGGEGALVFGIDIPWQLHDRNQGNIKSALAGRRVVESRQELRRRALVGDLLVAYQVIASALEERASLEKDLLPSAEAMLSETREGYQKGLINYLGVLAARKSLFEIRVALLDSTKRYLKAQNEIERLTRPTGLPVTVSSSSTES